MLHRTKPTKSQYGQKVRRIPPYSSYHYFLDYENIPECLQDFWRVKNYKEDNEAIEVFLTSPVDTHQLQELKTASSLMSAPNVDNRPKIDDFVLIFKVKKIKKGQFPPLKPLK